jgi:hypothetical protein
MKNIKDLIKYTLDKKASQLKNGDYFFVIPNGNIGSYVDGNGEISKALLSFDSISSWHYFNYIFDFLNKGSLNALSFSTSTFYAFQLNNINFSLGRKIETFKFAIQFHKAIKHMAQMLLLGWDEQAIKYGHMLIKMLYGKQYKGWHPAYRHPWFMLEIFCRWRGVDLDYGRLNYPKDMGVYQEVIKNWRTSDPALLSRLIEAVSEFHVTQSDEKEYENRTPDFSSSDYFVYAIEILLLLNIRERLGLPDYTPDHELMKLPVNNWHTQKTEIPKVELVERAKSKLLNDYPGIMFEI